MADMSKLNEMPMLPSSFTDDQLVEFSKQNNPTPWRIARTKVFHGNDKYVIVDATGKIVSGRGAIVRICRIINSTEG